MDDSKINTWNIVGDKMRIQQILINLLNNAVKFTDNGGRVYLDINQQIQGDNVEMEFVVEDNGCGMSEEFLPKLFNNFAQENRDPSKYGTGTGLGLVISKKFANMMGGDISVESKENVGSRFTVKIVLELGLQDEEIIDTASAWKQHHDDFSVLKGARILLAEDNEINAEVAQGLLDEVGATVDIASNGRIAVDMFNKSEEYHYDAILMDVRMPVMDGYEATARIKALPRMDSIDIPVIAMTADVMEETMKKRGNVEWQVMYPSL
jgi:CheY-like chemotaxis protein